MSRITSSISEVEVLKPLQKPWTISLTSLLDFHTNFSSMNMATETPRKKFQACKRMAHLFPNHHETSKRSEWEDGKALEKVADRVETSG